MDIGQKNSDYGHFPRCNFVTCHVCVSSISRLITRKSPSGIFRTCSGIYREVCMVSQFTGCPYVIFFSSKMAIVFIFSRIKALVV